MSDNTKYRASMLSGIVVYERSDNYLIEIDDLEKTCQDLIEENPSDTKVIKETYETIKKEIENTSTPLKKLSFTGFVDPEYRIDSYDGICDIDQFNDDENNKTYISIDKDQLQGLFSKLKIQKKDAVFNSKSFEAPTDLIVKEEYEALKNILEDWIDVTYINIGFDPYNNPYNEPRQKYDKRSREHNITSIAFDGRRSDINPKNIEKLSKFSKLETLEVSDVWSDKLIDVICELKKLNSLEINEINHTNEYDYRIKNSDLIKICDNLNQIKRLSLYDQNIENLDPLKKLNKLREISVGSNKIKQMAVLSELHQLRYIHIHENDIEDFGKYLSRLTNKQGICMTIDENIEKKHQKAILKSMRLGSLDRINGKLAVNLL